VARFPENVRHIFGSRRLAMLGRDCRLDREWTRLTGKRFLNEGKRLVDLWFVPERAILFFEYNEIAFFVESRCASRVV